MSSSEEAKQRARLVGLKYKLDDSPGFRRAGKGKQATYADTHGNPLRVSRHLERIRSLVIPPAWKRVWISPDANGHLQATGIDARGRKQYLYHPKWRVAQDGAKYERMLLFGKCLPGIRRTVQADLRLNGLPERKVLAAVVSLLEQTLIRVGNEMYAKSNRSYGLTTFRDNHVSVKGCRIDFQFRGKRNLAHRLGLDDCKIAKVVKRCRDVPGTLLFQYSDDSGARRRVTSADVNQYLKEISGTDITAKDFRTWSGTMICLQELAALETATSRTDAKRKAALAVRSVANRLGNTPAICRKSYIHPGILEDYVAGNLKLSPTNRRRAAGRAVRTTGDEHRLMKRLQQGISGGQVRSSKRDRAAIIKRRSRTSDRVR